MSVRAAGHLLLVLSGLALAEPPPPPAPSPPLPVIDPAKELKGAALLDALHAGGYVLYMRHGRQGGPQDEIPCSRANLIAEGVEQAKKVGEALHALKIPVGAVRASRFCRAIETARLLGFGEPQVTGDLDFAIGDSPLHAARRKRLAEAPPAGMNVLVVSHGHAGPNDADKVQLELAEIIVYRPDGHGAAEPVARIRLEDWARLR
jgi:broad specificity phosphatase PhoE